MARPREFDEDQALAAALEVFWEKGYEAASVQDLTERMGIQKASLYNTFGDKHALFVRALAAYSTDTLEWYRHQLERPGPVRATLAALFHELTDGCDDEDDDCRGCLCVNSAIELAPHDPAIATLLEQHNQAQEELFRSALVRAQQSGEVPVSLDTLAAARYLLNVIAGLGVAHKAGASRDWLHDTVRFSLSVFDRH
ncbi:MAG TPA: TetR/AcrR family transcriptional regulator [Gemmatimonadales bacterium]|nr:TetR/AcrR family transcriptional regulator [Gemmatimonadales bacterium]